MTNDKVTVARAPHFRPSSFVIATHALSFVSISSAFSSVSLLPISSHFPSI